MSIMTTAYQLIANDQPLRQLLARNPLDPSLPAVFDRWAAPNTPMPYVIMTWNFLPGDHWAKQNAFLVLDIFTQGSSTILAEEIRNRLIQVLDRVQIVNEREGLVRFHLVRHGDIPEDDPGVVHWDIEFNGIYWRRDDIQTINQREGV